MSEWMFWWLLGSMLWIGHLFRIGVFMAPLGASAALTGILAAATPLALDHQLEIFILLAGIQGIAVRRLRRRTIGMSP